MNGIILPAQIENIATRKDRSLKVTLSTQELPPGKAGELLGLQNQIVVVYISEKEIDQSQIDLVDKIDPEFQGKTQSQRIRNVLAVLYKQDNQGFKDFNSFYQSKTEMYINKLKTLIEKNE